MRKIWEDYRWIPATAVGSAVFALGFSLFLQPNEISPGGISGLALVAVELLGYGSVGVLTILINLPLFILGGVKIGRRFFGGSLLDGMISAGVGMLLRLMMRVLDRLQVPGVASTLLCAVIGGFFAHGLSHLGVPCAPDKVAIGNIMLLVPGIAMTNAIRDMFTGDTISGLLRFCESLLLSLALAWGFALPSALFL